MIRRLFFPLFLPRSFINCAGFWCQGNANLTHLSLATIALVYFLRCTELLLIHSLQRMTTTVEYWVMSYKSLACSAKHELLLLLCSSLSRNFCAHLLYIPRITFLSIATLRRWFKSESLIKKCSLSLCARINFPGHRGGKREWRELCYEKIWLICNSESSRAADNTKKNCGD